ncbi:hypothetical protein PENTCL1PPCAC_28617, partial [Pristionchus entomophagus]
MSDSLWIIFFVDQDILPDPFKSNFVILTIIEVSHKLVGDLLTLIVIFFAVYVFYKVQYFHFNLAVIWVNAYIIGLFYVTSRLILIPFQFGVFALCFVATYEKVPRRYISGIIIISNYIVSAFLGYLAVHKIIHGFYYLALVFITSNIAYLTVLYLNWAGKRKQNELLEKYRGYSVSYRWQLQQNIEAAKQLAVLMIIINLCISVILPCIFVPALLLDNDENGK